MKLGVLRCASAEYPDWLSLEDFLLPFGRELFGDTCLVKIAELIPWAELEGIYDVCLFCKVLGAQAMPCAWCGALIVNACLELAGEELVVYTAGNLRLHLFVVFGAFLCSTFYPSMIVCFRRRLSQLVVND